jgi:hypothetical protein
MADELMQALARLRREEHASEGPPPLADAAREDVLAGVFARLDAEAHDDAPHAAEVVPLARRRWIAPLLAVLAAAVLLVVLRPTASDSLLPSYSITRARGGDAAVRSTPDGPTQHLLLKSSQESIEIVVTPSTATSTVIDVVLVARRADREPVRSVVTDRAQIAPQGAIRLHGPLDRFIALEPGTWRIDIVVSPAGATDREHGAVASLEITIASP